jgi:transcriptional regulator with XRE-family HTH domain
MTTNRQVGELIHHAMWRQRMTQAQVAEALGITQPALSKKIRGSRPWSVDELLRVAEVLGVPVESLLPTNRPNPGPGRRSADPLFSSRMS